jgi:hypothetical protein
MIGGRILDVSAIVGFATSMPYPQAVVFTALEQNVVLAIPSGVVYRPLMSEDEYLVDAISRLIEGATPEARRIALERVAARTGEPEPR